MLLWQQSGQEIHSHSLVSDQSTAIIARCVVRIVRQQVAVQLADDVRYNGR